MATTPHHAQLTASSDSLGEILHLLRLTGVLYCRAELTAPWAVEVPALPGLMAFAVVTSGAGWLELDGEPPRQLRQGDLALIPHGVPHRFSSGPGLPFAPLFEIPVERVGERYEIMRHGGGGALTQVTCGVMRLDHIAAESLVALLPRVLLIRAEDDTAGQWLHSTLALIAVEGAALRPGGETVMTRLADILVIQAIRSWLETSPDARTGWLAALRDEKLGRATAAMHRAPHAGWTVATLAREAGMSRSAFSARFTDLVGEPAMRYLTRWRLQLARMALRDGPQSLAGLARSSGYVSEAAFSRAFKRQFGMPPGGVRRALAGETLPRNPEVATTLAG
jgi:AraC-like DNA-binding protein